MDDISNMKDSCGIVYVAFGYEYLLMAAYSAYSAKKFNNGIKCSLVTNLKIIDKGSLNDIFDYVTVVDEDNIDNRLIKTQAIKFAPFDKCLFLDCDTEVRGDLSVMFQCLDRFDVIMKMNSRPYLKDYEVSEGVPGYLLPICNSGVIFFRNGSKAETFFNNWQSNFVKFGKKSDQPALACAIYQQPDLRFLSVNALWNTFPVDRELLTVNSVRFKSKIWHYRKVEDFPEMVFKVFHFHTRLLKAVNAEDGIVGEEIDEVESRYNILSSFCYQNNLLRPFFLKYFWIIKFLIGKKGLELHRKSDRVTAAFDDVTESKMTW